MISYEDVQQFVRESDDVIKLLKYNYESLGVETTNEWNNLILKIKVDDRVTIRVHETDSIELVIKQGGAVTSYDGDMEDLRHLMASEDQSTFNDRLRKIITPEFDVENDGIDELYDFLPFSPECSKVNRNGTPRGIMHFLQGIGRTAEVLFINTRKFEATKNNSTGSIILDYDHNSNEWIVILPYDHPIRQNYENRYKFTEFDCMVKFIQDSI